MAAQAEQFCCRHSGNPPCGCPHGLHYLMETLEPVFICHQKQIEKKCLLSSSHLPVSHKFLLLAELDQKPSWQAWEMWFWGALASEIQCRTKEGTELKADTQTDAETERMKGAPDSRELSLWLRVTGEAHRPDTEIRVVENSRPKAHAEWRGEVFSWAVKERTYFLPSQIRLHEEWYFELGLEEFSKLYRALQKCQFT